MATTAIEAEVFTIGESSGKHGTDALAPMLTWHLTMKLEGIPFQTVDWSKVAVTTHPGEAGITTWRTLEVGNIRVRLLEYSAGYVADHWCERGHVIHVLEGELHTELRDGRSFLLRAGESYVVADGDGAHRSRTSSGARLFVTD